MNLEKTISNDLQLKKTKNFLLNNTIENALVNVDTTKFYDTLLVLTDKIYSKKAKKKPILNPNLKPYVCIVCYQIDTYYNKWFKCQKYHHLCHDCFKQMNKTDIKCPLCRAEPFIHYKAVDQLTYIETINIDLDKVSIQNIDFHKDFNYTNMIKNIVCSNNNMTKLYMLDGVFAIYKGMFVGVNGYLYDYNKKLQSYNFAIRNSKFQCWDKTTFLKKIL
jgi:hypothetical protein